LKLEKLSFNTHIAQLLTGVNWKAVNDQFKRDYDKAINHVLDQIEAKGANRTDITLEVDKICEQLGALGLQRAKQRHRPPVEIPHQTGHRFRSKSATHSV